MSRARDDAGSASVLGVQLLAVLGMVMVAAVAVVAVVVAHRRAQNAADLAALAAAAAVQQGQPACAAAGDLALDNDSRLVSCVVNGEVVTVRTSAATGVVLGRVRWATGQARAGPVDATRAAGLR